MSALARKVVDVVKALTGADGAAVSVIPVASAVLCPDDQVVYDMRTSRGGCPACGSEVGLTLRGLIE